MTDHYKTAFPLPTAYQDELLKNLIEECAEVIQRASKMQRFGILEVQKGQDQNNTQRLGMETGNLVHMISVCIAEGLIDAEMVDQGMIQKERKLPQYLQHKKDV